MTTLQDVNTTDIIDAIRLGCRTMSSIFNADDGDLPFWRANARPNAFLGICWEDHVPGRHLNALLNAEDAAGIEIDEDAIDKHARAAFLSFSGPLALPMRRVGGKPTQFSPHNLREGLHALYALVKYRDSDRARQLVEACIEVIFEYFDLLKGWDGDRLDQEHGLIFKPMPVFVQGVGRAIGPLVKYYRTTGYARALELAIVLKDKTIHEVFLEDGAYDPARFGTHVHSVTCVMSSLAQLADMTSDSVLMNRVKLFYDHGLWKVRDPLGWSIESGKPDNEHVDEGEANNTGDILETALILGRWGHVEYYHDAERILRGHLLPSQLRDISFIQEPDNRDGTDELRNIACRLRGSFGAPAPYGHEPLELNGRLERDGITRLPSVSFETDIVGGVVGSLCEALREGVRFDPIGHRVNLLFDFKDDNIEVASPYTHSSLTIRVKRPAPLFVRVPPWVDRKRLYLDLRSALDGTSRAPRYFEQ